MQHMWHKHMATPNVFYGKFSDVMIATSVVKHGNFLFGWQVSFLFGVCFFMSDGTRQGRIASCHTCNIYHVRRTFVRGLARKCILKNE